MIKAKTFKPTTDILIQNDNEIKIFMDKLNIDKTTATWVQFEVLSSAISFYSYHNNPKELARVREQWANLTTIIIKLKEVNLYEVKNTKLQKLLKVINTITKSL